MGYAFNILIIKKCIGWVAVQRGDVMQTRKWNVTVTVKVKTRGTQVMLLSSMDQKQTSSLARYLDGEFWEIKDAFRDAISKCELFQSSR